MVVIEYGILSIIMKRGIKMSYQKRDDDNCVVRDLVKGNIKQESNTGPKVLWKAVGIEPSGNVRVINTSDCAMEITIVRTGDRENIRLLILPGRERVVTVSCMERIELITIGSRDMDCTGKFCLEIYYCLPGCSCDDHGKSCNGWEGTCD